MGRVLELEVRFLLCILYQLGKVLIGQVKDSEVYYVNFQMLLCSIGSWKLVLSYFKIIIFYYLRIIKNSIDEVN